MTAECKPTDERWEKAFGTMRMGERASSCRNWCMPEYQVAHSLLLMHSLDAADG